MQGLVAHVTRSLRAADMMLLPDTTPPPSTAMYRNNSTNLCWPTCRHELALLPVPSSVGAMAQAAATPRSRGAAAPCKIERGAPCRAPPPRPTARQGTAARVRRTAAAGSTPDRTAPSMALNKWCRSGQLSNDIERAARTEQCYRRRTSMSLPTPPPGAPSRERRPTMGSAPCICLATLFRPPAMPASTLQCRAPAQCRCCALKAA